VYEKADPNVNVLPHGRTNEAPKVDKYWEGSQASEKPSAPESKGPAELGISLTQARDNFDANKDNLWNDFSNGDPNNVDNGADMYDDQWVYGKAGHMKLV
jgi:hypothetical protein